MHLSKIHPSFRSLLKLTGIAALAVGSLSAESPYPVAVFSKVYNGYTREKLPDRSYKSELYALAEGGCWSGPSKEISVDGLTYPKVADAVADPLARLKYLPAASASDAQLLILVFWGVTQGSEGHDPMQATDQLSTAMNDFYRLQASLTHGKVAVMNSLDGASSRDDRAAAAGRNALEAAQVTMAIANAQRDRIDAHNAHIIGYDKVLKHAQYTAYMSDSRDVLNDVADNRYYVVLQAYDFPTALKEKKLRPLWTVRMSMTNSGHDFASALDAMLKNGARFFGQDQGLNRWVIPEGHIKYGPAKVLETKK
jgi:hypothetical protein